jgi:hypothetical protein
MAAGCPVVVPCNSSFVEIVGETRGYLVPSGGDIDHLAIPYGISDNPRPLVHADKMIKTLDHVYHHRKEAKYKASVAREWTERHTWQHVQEHWNLIFRQVQHEHYENSHDKLLRQP